MNEILLSRYLALRSWLLTCERRKLSSLPAEEPRKLETATGKENLATSLVTMVVFTLEPK